MVSLFKLEVAGLKSNQVKSNCAWMKIVGSGEAERERAPKQSHFLNEFKFPSYPVITQNGNLVNNAEEFAQRQL